MFAVPVCGPYSALVNYKYKIKVTPGSLKPQEGEGCQASLSLSLSHSLTPSLNSGAGARERDLIRAMPETEKRS